MLRQVYKVNLVLGLSFLLAGCATVVNNPPPGPSPAAQPQPPVVNALILEHNRNMAAYAHQVNEIVAHFVREVRVEKEQEKIKEVGHPVPLPTGGCSAILSIDRRGQLRHAELAACLSDFLGDVELEAIKRAAPFPPPGAPLNVTVRTYARVATPGVNGN